MARIVCEICGETKSKTSPHPCDDLLWRWRYWLDSSLETALYAYARSRLCVRDRYHVEDAGRYGRLRA